MKNKLIVLLLIVCCLCLCGCASLLGCNHKDANKDCICDKCKQPHHTAVIVPPQQPTCLVDGHEGYKVCNNCQTELTSKVTIEKLGHSDQNMDCVCDNCNKNLDHVDTDGNYLCDNCQTELPGPPCTTHVDENGDHVCDVCNQLVPPCQTHVDENGDCLCDVCNYEHHEVATISGKAPTCEEDGRQPKIYCPKCGFVYQQDTVIDKLGHQDNNEDCLCDNECGTEMHEIVTIPEEPSTCQQMGKSEKVFCSKCQHVFQERNFLPYADHKDDTHDGNCDWCNKPIKAELDLFVLNDLHGKVVDSESQPGLEEMTTYLKNQIDNTNGVLLASGDMWQGSSESNVTKGALITDWMNQMGFVGMTLGNHEFDWGEQAVIDNSNVAEFPFLAINVYNRNTNTIADYCQPSVMVEKNGIKIGIIGAIGDCYSSISASAVSNVYFITGSQLTNLVKEESQKLREQGADVIVYSLHDGSGNSNSSPTQVGSSTFSAYYDVQLSNGYVDIVFEAHSHQKYIYIDQYGVYHLQGGGDNSGLSHAKLSVNVFTNKVTVEKAEIVGSNTFGNYPQDGLIDQLLQKYDHLINDTYRVLGYNSARRSSSTILNLCANLYAQKGLETWGNNYNIVLGGGFMSARSPYNLEAGEVTYSMLYSILPFDNKIVLCSISGRKLKEVFINTSNNRYYISYTTYGNSIKNNIDNNATYYVVTDTYSSDYSYNQLTVVAELDSTTFARDLVAEFIQNGGWDNSKSVANSTPVVANLPTTATVLPTLNNLEVLLPQNKRF